MRNRRASSVLFSLGGSALLVAVIASWSSAGPSSGAARSAATGPTCPPVGADTDCGTIITIDDSGTTITSTGQGPYDSIEDTLIGVVNNSSLPVNALGLKSAATIFAFDGDGIDTFGIPGNTRDSTGYGGPNAFFTSINGAQTEGIVNFITPIAAKGGTAFFSLEEAVSNAISCRDAINNSVPRPPGGGTTMSATFTPNLGLTLSQAEFFCGFKDFDWQQFVTTLPAPSPYAQIGKPNVQLVAPPQFLDPVAGGYTSCDDAGNCVDHPDNSFPFYLDPNNGELAGQETATTLAFSDTPSDSCLPGGRARGCKGKTAPAGSFVAFTTHLAGVNFDGTATDLGIGFSWKTTFNGTSGNTSTTKNFAPVDPGSGTGSITVTAYQPTTNYQYNGITVTTINGQPVTNNRPPDCSAAVPSVSRLWPANHRMVPVAITGVTDPDGDPVALQVTQVSQDEPVNATGDGNTCPDASGVGTDTANLRAERSGNGDGRVYHVQFTASDGSGGSCTGEVTVCVPHSASGSCADQGPTQASDVCP
jgi:hypothetical protein